MHIDWPHLDNATFDSISMHIPHSSSVSESLQASICFVSLEIILPQFHQIAFKLFQWRIYNSCNNFLFCDISLRVLTDIWLAKEDKSWKRIRVEKINSNHRNPGRVAFLSCADAVCISSTYTCLYRGKWFSF